MQPSWDDLNLVLCIADHGGVLGAARALGVHHATVLRRLDTFERRAGVILFERSKAGYMPTELGVHIAERARALSGPVQSIFREIAGEDLRLSGTLRITTADFIAQRLLPPVLTAFRARHPSVTVELVTSPTRASLSKRDADIALRVMDSAEADESLTQEPVLDLDFAVYRSRALALDDVNAATWIVDDTELKDTLTQLWWRRDFANATVGMHVNSTLTRLAAIKAGVGIGFLPTVIARADAELVQVHAEADWRAAVHLLTHRDLARLPRITSLRHAWFEVYPAQH